jgi:hypothetical protein
MADAFPHYDPLNILSEDVLDVLERGGTFTIEELFDALQQSGRRYVGSRDNSCRVSLSLTHVQQVLESHLQPHVKHQVGEWSLESPRPSCPPPWKVFPFVWGSMGWRMGSGEDYWYKFAEGYRALSNEAMIDYRTRHPEPADWQEFYSMMSLPQGDQLAWNAWRERRDAAVQKFLEGAYQQGRRAEDDGELDEAADQYGIMIQYGMFRDALERLKRLRPGSMEEE